MKITVVDQVGTVVWYELWIRKPGESAWVFHSRSLVRQEAQKEAMRRDRRGYDVDVREVRGAMHSWMGR